MMQISGAYHQFGRLLSAGAAVTMFFQLIAGLGPLTQLPFSKWVGVCQCGSHGEPLHFGFAPYSDSFTYLYKTRFKLWITAKVTA